jgi:CrcB protein
MIQKTSKPKLLLLTFIGGAVGSALRYGLVVSLPQAAWLWVVNILGALILGFVHVNKRFAEPKWQSLIGTGFAGGFTTMSSLVLFGLMRADPNFLYLAQQIGAGVAVYWLGRFLGGERSWSKS